MEASQSNPVKTPLEQELVKREIECDKVSPTAPQPISENTSNDDASSSGESEEELDDEDDGKLCTLAEKSAKFSCEDCGRNYSTSGYLRKHRARCNKPVYHPCHLCEKVLTTGQELRYHLNEHSGERPYACRQTPGCREAFPHPRFRVMHEQRCGGGPDCQESVEQNEVVVDGMVKLTCSRCGKLCKTPGLFRRHKRSCFAKKSCHLCEKEFKSVQSLEYHLNWHTGDKPYKCQVGCEKSFINPHHRRNHEKICGPVVVRDPEGEEGDKKKIHACDQCNMKYGMMGHLLRHKRACHNDNPTEGYVCPVCKAEFKKATLLRYHIYEHNGEKPFKCYNEGCTEAFSTPMRRHEHNVTCGRSLDHYRCDVCNMALKTANSLRIHRLTHEKPTIICKICGAGYHHAFRLRNHMKSHAQPEKPAEPAPKPIKLEPGLEHQEVVEPLPVQVPTPEHRCHQCKRTFSTEKRAKRHLEFCRKSCHLCPAKFRNAPELGYHLAMHRGEMQCECRKSCGQKFWNPRDRNKHEKTCGTPESEQTDKPPSATTKTIYTCDHCSKSYTSPGYLLRHKQLCNNSEPLTSNLLLCPHCPETFARSDWLRYHLNKHTGETPYPCRTKDCKAAFGDPLARLLHEKQCAAVTIQCPICEKVLKSANLKTHMAHYHMAPKHECPDCGVKFVTRNQVKLHQKKKHQPKEESTYKKEMIQSDQSQEESETLESTITIKEEQVQSDQEDEEIVGI
uniref:Putative zinc finger protein n=1 Tax=Culex tarsalis TaxID=7177 RepID=A0A1Q3FG48_CULTA